MAHVALAAPADELVHELVELRGPHTRAGTSPARVARSCAIFAAP
jgi:hypothetical protein